MAVWAPMHTTRWGLLSQPDKQKPPSAEGTGVPFNALPAACWAIPNAAAVAMAPTLGTNFGSELVPCMAKGTLLKPPPPLTFSRPGMPRRERAGRTEDRGYSLGRGKLSAVEARGTTWLQSFREWPTVRSRDYPNLRPRAGPPSAKTSWFSPTSSRSHLERHKQALYFLLRLLLALGLPTARNPTLLIVSGRSPPL